MRPERAGRRQRRPLHAVRALRALRALSFAAALGGPLAPALAAEPDPVRQRQAQEAQQRGDHRTAAALLEREVDAMRRAHGDDDPQTLGLMGDLADVYLALGRIGEALPLAERTAERSLVALERGHPDTLAAMGRLAQLLQLGGRGDDAIGWSERALALAREVRGHESLPALDAMTTLANRYTNAGRFGEALALEQQALALGRRLRFENHPDTLVAMGNLASTYRRLGRFEDAAELEQQVLRQFERSQGERADVTLIAMNNLGGTYAALGRHDEAAALHEKVLKARTASRGERHPDTLGAMLNLAGDLQSLGRLPEALALAERARTLTGQALGERHPTSLAALDLLADLLRATGRPAEALPLRERQLALSTELHGPQHPATLAAVGALAFELALAGRLREATRLTDRYVDGAEHQRTLPGLAAEDRRALFASHAQVYRLFSVFNALDGDTPRGWRLAELGKARSLLDSMTAQRAARAGVLPPADRAALDALVRQLGELDQRLALAPTLEARQALEPSRLALVRQLETLQAALRDRHPKYARLSDVRVVDAARLPGLVPADAIAISYLVDKDWVCAWLVGPDGVPAFVDLGSIPNLAQLVTIARRGAERDGPLALALAADGQRAWRLANGGFVLRPAAQAPPPGAVELTDATQVNGLLGQRLLLPLEQRLQGRRRWIISPDGPLALLPFELLPFGGAHRTVLDVADVHLTQSLSVFALGRELQAQYEQAGPRRALLAMGHAQYRPVPERVRERRRAGLAPALRGLVGQVGLVGLEQLDGLWEPLPGTEREVKAVARLFPGASSVYLGEQATEQQLQALNAAGALRGYRYLLLSAHGYVSHEQPALSAIVLGLTRRTPQADGYVTAAEWPAYDLRSDVAVLSACETALGRVVGGEGVMGLPFALFVAGNVNTVLTLWAVDDDATVSFVTRLFARLQKGQPAAQALADTKRELARDRRWSHPRFWAPFVLVGPG